MKKKQCLTNRRQKHYIQPMMEVYLVTLEESVAVGSARIIPTTNVSQVYEEWDENIEDKVDVEW